MDESGWLSIGGGQNGTFCKTRVMDGVVRSWAVGQEENACPCRVVVDVLEEAGVTRSSPSRAREREAGVAAELSEVNVA